MTQCSALASAMRSKGFDSTQLATETKLNKQRVDDIVNGTAQPSQDEFNTIARVLGVSGSYQQHTLQAK